MDNARFVTLDGVRTRYFEAGTGDDLVLIHGGKYGTFYSAYHWSLNFHELSKHFHVYAFDKLGMGDSSRAKDTFLACRGGAKGRQNEKLKTPSRSSTQFRSAVFG